MIKRAQIGGGSMIRIAILLAVAAGLAACDLVGTLTHGISYARAVEGDLESATGIRPQVGFNWHNGSLRQVTVTFPRLYDTKPLREVAASVRAAVEKEFKQVPDNIVLGFALGKQGTGRVANSSDLAAAKQ
jgi:hypothetical protein